MQTTTMPRNTAWCQRKRTASVPTLALAQTSRRREPMALTGPYDKRCCPNAQGQLPKEELGRVGVVNTLESMLFFFFTFFYAQNLNIPPCTL